MNERPIVVGVDSVDTSTPAVRWAAREAVAREAPLRIVHVLDWDGNTSRYDFDGSLFTTARRLAEAVPAAAADLAREAAPGVRVRTEVLIGHPAAQFLDTGDAELLVVGHRGRGGFAGLLLGSVSQRLATHASGPVVVVRGRPDVADGPVVAGVDDSPAADLVMDAAFDAAARHDSHLVVIRSRPIPAMAYLAGVPVTELTTPEEDAAEHDRLLAQLAPWQEKYPDVPVKALLSHDSAASALIGVSSRARLVIVGNHGHGVLAGTLLGSTGLQLLHHADCPVQIVRPLRQR
ncbi:universal stress protein [Actinoplanes oblitus]|uniref:Universal stress protein n=1 Tax=Actinoplanes oblitus TaxID=3040509 RepID=A0ABY8W9H0_9ACTN|nr:universal stress protein [Actinoplanes oblitus]WIM94491.1 universal stress protein [Actinoplanes oblitus]